MTYNQLTTKKFIEKAKIIHGDKYELLKVIINEQDRNTNGRIQGDEGEN